ncbi:uncharacterized protein At4g02000-like [Pyrus communis]|uniref:uncharacterized protein At4g02000-like n=1 Tax=Pyrus communis TaxID=23211 RepID=UPI0035C1703F
MESGVKLIAKVLVEKPVNKWGVWNILKSAWKEFGEIQINWVQDNRYVVLVCDESVANRILELVPWAVMKQNLSVKRWTENLVIEEVQMHMVHFWVQMKGIPPSLCSDGNISRLANKYGDLMEVEDLTKARGFLRLRIMVDTSKPLASGCWVTRKGLNESWVDFQYERLQDFCYKCGRIGHASLECSATESNTDVTRYGEWTRTRRIIDETKAQRKTNIAQGMRRQERLVGK